MDNILQSTPALQAVYLNKKINCFSKSWKSASSSCSPCSSCSSIASSSFTRSRCSSTFSSLSEIEEREQEQEQNLQEQQDSSDDSIPLFDDIPLFNPEYFQADEPRQLSSTSCTSSLISNSFASTHEEILNDDHPLSNLSDDSISTTTTITPVTTRTVKQTSPKKVSKFSAMVSKLSSFLSSTSQKIESYDFHQFEPTAATTSYNTSSIDDNFEFDEMKYKGPDVPEYELLRQYVSSIPDTCFVNRNTSESISCIIERSKRMHRDQLRQIAMYQNCCDLELVPSEVSLYEVDIYNDYVNNKREFEYLYQEDSYIYECDDSSNDEGNSVDHWGNSIINHIRTDHQYVEELRIIRACCNKYCNPALYENGVRVVPERWDLLPQTIRYFKNLELYETELQFAAGFHANVNEKALFSLDDFIKQEELNQFNSNLKKVLNLKKYSSLRDDVQFVSKKSNSVPARFSNVITA